MLIDYRHNPENKPTTGKLLLAEPFMQDSFFERTVILLCENNSSGSLGLVLNKKSNKIFCLNNSDSDEKIRVPIYEGGFVQPEQFFFIHTLGSKIPNSISISDEISWGNDFEYLEYYISKKEISPNTYRLFSGYSGWVAGQLNQEIKENTWIICNNVQKKNIFMDAKNLWRKVLYNMGGTFKFYSNVPKNPSLN